MFNPIQYISQGDTPQEQLYHIESVLDAGQRWIQFRFKDTLTSIRWKTAEQVKLLCDSYHATLLINDDPDLALAIDADGVHLGLQDRSIAEARALLPHKIIGGTANTLADVKQRLDESCDYIGLGPLRYTLTKKKLSPLLGFEGYQQLLTALTPEEKQIPIVAIGGITLTDVPVLQKIGLSGIAVSSLLHQAQSPQQLIQQLNTYFL
ncbi:thiamine-phosphate pyrophosphorylase [Myroides gitamensis]|uniref:Thiamine-phosphate synthase n=1 Tax=Myroides odoratus TaxID=256 RepID=A0A378U3H5_MYROD|nr:thiamine phosphate synthase [Myroides odoratus]MCS4239910.1 thiamine-phosphate pyrophosphorylase [Myroides odoratus]MDH6602594.1 thiamine-phosphate pyrophosphorylase [Myroides gitamensis]QQU03712.1 thiamine phosphate synthase [Myroides odoratus]STZ69010.1 Thiamine-phosphate synthase [Myroides odoratus]